MSTPRRQARLLEKTESEKKAVTVKRPLVGVFLGYPLYDEVEAATKTEPVRSMAAFVLEIFRYGWGAYQRVGSLKEMKELTARGATRGPAIISQETWSELITALEIIVSSAPNTVVEDLVGYLTTRAGKYGKSKAK